MSLGGYKFAGYKCTKPEGATDAEWALLIHKTRLKAFVEANTLAGDIWEFDRNSGDVAFETYGNVIYYADRTDPLNLVSFFKHSAEDKYYAIISAFNYFNVGSYTGPVHFTEKTNIVAYYTTDSNYQRSYAKQLFHVVSYARLSEDFLLYNASGDNYPNSAISLVPVTNFQTYSGSGNAVTPSASNEYFKQAVLNFGYTIRDKNITTISVNGTDFSNTDLFKVSLVGFDSLSLSSVDDSANIYGINFGTSTPSINPNSWGNNIELPCNALQCTLKDNFQRYEQTGLWSALALSPASKATFGGSPTVFPYEAVSLRAIGSRVTQPFLNSNGITSKGSFDISLLAANGANPYTLVSTMGSYANGNYLLVMRQKYNSPTANLSQTNYYIGWDPSNPDITRESAWTAYNG